jgi:hypothetical protein
MNRKAAVFTFLVIVMAATAAADCENFMAPTVLPFGNHAIGADILWLHEAPVGAPGLPYTLHKSLNFTGTGIPGITDVDGYPTRVTWTVTTNGEPPAVYVVDCPLFTDGFETGTTGEWSQTHGGAYHD